MIYYNIIRNVIYKELPPGIKNTENIVELKNDTREEKIKVAKDYITDYISNKIKHILSCREIKIEDVLSVRMQATSPLSTFGDIWITILAEKQMADILITIKYFDIPGIFLKGDIPITNVLLSKKISGIFNKGFFKFRIKSKDSFHDNYIENTVFILNRNRISRTNISDDTDKFITKIKIYFDDGSNFSLSLLSAKEILTKKSIVKKNMLNFELGVMSEIRELYLREIAKTQDRIITNMKALKKTLKHLSVEKSKLNGIELPEDDVLVNQVK